MDVLGALARIKLKFFFLDCWDLKGAVPKPTHLIYIICAAFQMGNPTLMLDFEQTPF